MTDTMRNWGVPGDETERETMQAIATVTDAFWRARHMEQAHGLGSPQHRAAMQEYVTLADTMREAAHA